MRVASARPGVRVEPGYVIYRLERAGAAAGESADDGGVRRLWTVQSEGAEPALWRMAPYPGGNGEVCARTWPGRWRQRCAGNAGEERGGGTRRDEDFETEHEADFAARVDEGRA